MSSHEELRTIALSEFARAGYGATSLQRIAELAGLSKSSVLYHYSSKDALLKAVISPAIDRCEEMIAAVEGLPFTPERRSSFILAFVDFLLVHRNAVHMFINQGRSLEDVPVIERANAIVLRMAAFFSASVSTTEDRMRFGVALGGAAYTLVTQQNYGVQPPPLDETRAALISIMTELLDPVSARPVLS